MIGREPRVIAFDLDCTLVDVLAVKRRAACAAAARLAGDARDPVSTGDLVRALLAHAIETGIDRDDVVETFAARRGLTDAARVSAAAAAWADAERAPSAPYPGVVRLLTALAARGVRLAVVTDAPRAKAWTRLEAAGLARFFETVVTFEDSPHGKADAMPFVVACDRLGVHPRDLLVVGDNPVRDVAVPRAIGCRTALARYGLGHAFASPRHERLADVTLHVPADLLALFSTPAPAVLRAEVASA